MSTSPPRQMHLSTLINGTGNQLAAWRLPEADVGAVDFDLLLRITEIAERGKLDMVFLADSVTSGTNAVSSVHLEVLTILAGLATRTSHIGLAATVSTTYAEPYNVARMISSIDHMSGGRAGWNVVTTANEEAAFNFGLSQHPPKEERYERAAEFVEVVKGLWDSWEDGALLQDKATGRFVDLDKRHELNHKGRFYSVKGALNISRSPQGYPVIIQAGASNTGLPLAAAIGEVVFTVQDTLEGAKDFRTSLLAAAEKLGRDPGQVKVLPGITPIVVDSEKEGQELLQRLASFTSPENAWAHLATRLGMDVSHLPPEGPVPKIPPEQMRGYAKILTAAAQRHNFNLRQLRDYDTVTSGHHMVIGSAQKVADGLEEWFGAGAADGFMLRPPWFLGAFERFIDEVVPILQQRGLFRTDYTGKTLRDHLGLRRPPHPKVREGAQAG